MRTLPVISNRARLCLSCREKKCCSYYTVTVTARDYLRIARAMQLAPSDFLTYQVVPAGEDGFQLSPDGERYAMTLARRQGPDETSSPCIFLLRTNDQHGVCGLGDLRPAQCGTFPTYLADGFVGVVNKPDGCVRTWSYGDIDVNAERRQLIRAGEEEAEHQALIDEWNRRVQSGGRARGFDEFCAFIVNHAEEPEGVL